jgi:hypothetical protein
MQLRASASMPWSSCKLRTSRVAGALLHMLAAVAEGQLLLLLRVAVAHGAMMLWVAVAHGAGAAGGRVAQVAP